MARKPVLQFLSAAVVPVAVFLVATIFAPDPPPPAIAAAPASPVAAPPPPPAAPAGADGDLALGEEASWNPGDGPATFRAGDIEVAVRSLDADETSYEAVVRQGRRAPLVIRTGEMPPIGCCTISVGRLDRTGARYVMLATFTEDSIAAGASRWPCRTGRAAASSKSAPSTHRPISAAASPASAISTATAGSTS